MIATLTLAAVIDVVEHDLPGWQWLVRSLKPVERTRPGIMYMSNIINPA